MHIYVYVYMYICKRVATNDRKKNSESKGFYKVNNFYAGIDMWLNALPDKVDVTSQME